MIATEAVLSQNRSAQSPGSTDIEPVPVQLFPDSVHDKPPDVLMLEPEHGPVRTVTVPTAPVTPALHSTEVYVPGRSGTVSELACVLVTPHVEVYATTQSVVPDATVALPPITMAPEPPTFPVGSVVPLTWYFTPFTQ